MKSLVIALFGLLVVGVLEKPSQAAPFNQLTEPKAVLIKYVAGTIEAIDHAGRLVTIQTELGNKESFTLPRAAVLLALTEGDRINVEMDDQGKVRKIVKTTPDILKTIPEPRG